MRSLDGARFREKLREGYQQYSSRRRLRRIIIENMAGPHHRHAWKTSDPKRPESMKNPSNLLLQVTNTWLANIVGQRVRADVEGLGQNLAFPARLRQMRLERLCDKIKLAQIHEDVVLDAMVTGLGIYRTGLKAGSKTYQINGEQFDPGVPFACRVDLDDYASDPFAKVREEEAWRANRLVVTDASLVESGIIDINDIDDIPWKRTRREWTTELRGDMTDFDDRTYGTEDALRVIEPWDVAIYDGDTVLQGLYLAEAQKWLVEPREIEAPTGSPYEFLEFLRVNNSVMPVSLLGNLLDLHSAIAAVSTKLTRQILAAKTVFGYEKAAEEIAIQAIQADDMESIAGASKDKMGVFEMGGIIGSLYQGVDWLSGMANNQAGALQQLNGTKDIGKTAYTSQLLQNNAQTLLARPREKSLLALQNVVGKLAWYLEHDPLTQEVFPHRLPGGETVDVQWDPDSKEGDFENFNFRVRAFEPATIDPATERLRFLDMMDRMPMHMQAIQAVGGNVEAYVRLTAERMDEPELDQIFPTQEWLQMSQVLQSQPQGQVTGVQPIQPKPGLVGLGAKAATQPGGGPTAATQPQNTQPAPRPEQVAGGAR